VTLTHARPKGLSAVVSANPHIEKVPFSITYTRQITVALFKIAHSRNLSGGCLD